MLWLTKSNRAHAIVMRVVWFSGKMTFLTEKHRSITGTISLKDLTCICGRLELGQFIFWAKLKAPQPLCTCHPASSSTGAASKNNNTQGEMIETQFKKNYKTWISFWSQGESMVCASVSLLSAVCKAQLRKLKLFKRTIRFAHKLHQDASKRFG